ncbi:MAG: FAD binding domain-containing protein [Gammaproteobacteria bacterium]|nr:FAD binding domain-containing protein [Gammaproteobacteria bacterium]
MIRFLLNKEEVSLGDSRADETVLDYLRERRRKCGSKEGCASGDCGACTVVVAAPGEKSGALQYRAINSCIAFVGALHGRQLITVEDLEDDGALHPVQRAMVEQHGSQCGFCTPGFVMSMFALYKNRQARRARGVVPRREIEEALGGNLCRCTGYRPIIDAARQALFEMRDDQFNRGEAECARRLRKIAAEKPRAPHFHLPQSAREVAELLEKNPSARLLAGGTDLALETTQQLKALDEIICLRRAAELRRVRVCNRKDAVSEKNDGEKSAATMSATMSMKKARDKTGTHWEIGAAAPLGECGELLAGEYPDLAELLRRFGSAQVRNQATLGGNIANASPIADLPPALIALGAEVVLQRGAKLHRLEVEKFFLDYKKTALQKGEFIRSVLLPRASQRARLFAYKVSKRIDDDISAVCAVFYVETDGAKISGARAAFGGMAAVPKRAMKCERALRGRAFDERMLENAARALAEDFTPISDARASAEYRTRVAQNLLRRLQIELFEPETAARVDAYVHAERILAA